MRPRRDRNNEFSRFRRFSEIFWPAKKCDMHEVEKPMFRRLDRTYELIFYILASRKCDLAEVEKPIFQGVCRPSNSFFTSGRTKFYGLSRKSHVSSLRIHFLPSARSKMRLRRGRKRDVSTDLWVLQNIFLSNPNATWVRPRMRCFKESLDLSNSLSNF
jgi:hypothetical protein